MKYWAALVLGCTLIAVYWLGFQIHPFGDNLQLVDPDASLNPVTYLLHAVPGCLTYRPIQAAIMAWSQCLFGPFATWPLMTLQLGLHALLGWVVMRVARDLGLRAAGQFAACAVFLLASVNVLAVVDNLSQVISTTAGTVLLWQLIKRFHGAMPQTITSCTFMTMLAATAVLAKETGTAYVLSSLAIIALKGPDVIRSRRMLCLGVALAAIGVGYLVLRAGLPLRQPGLGSGRYEFALGLNVPKNLALLGGACFTPVSTVQLMDALREKKWATVAAAALLGATTFSVAWYGWAYGIGRRLRWPILALGACLLFPVFLMNRVSEVYTYNVMPLVALCIGAGFAELASVQRYRVPSGVVLAAVLTISAHATAAKTRLVYLNGASAAMLIQRIVPLIQAAPANHTIALVNTSPPGGEYSLYVMRDFNVLWAGCDAITRLAGRTDVRLMVVEAEQCDRLAEMVPGITVVRWDQLRATREQVREADSTMTALSRTCCGG